ncbi:hypothetical protein HFO10_00695 [Rhizobium laguerreae]|uniref:DUF6602 domain-containing protein n=1 Tax=Rhizobium laguerreae TaxID=1076926 RepID=UPI001C90D326|nr:DUF6602 domain-containing protein [Rhizobium laguerreae]MBY3294490.1 hypothetical protein [Rhizobium laguerreae]
MKPKLGELIGLVAKDFDLAFARGALHSRPDHTGRPRETQVRKFLRDMLPPKYGVARGYIVYPRWEGGAQIVADVTKEFDIIIFRAETCPNLVIDEETGTRLVPIEDVYGVVEAKSVLTEQTLSEAISKLAELSDPAHRAKMTRSDKRGREHSPFTMVFSYQGSKKYGTRSTARVRLAERLDSNDYGGGVQGPDAVVVLDQEFVIPSRDEAALQRGYMVRRWTTMAGAEKDEEYLNFTNFAAAMEGNRGHVPEYWSLPVSRQNGAIAFYALLLGFLERQRLVDYDLGELLCLVFKPRPVDDDNVKQVLPKNMLWTTPSGE